MDTLVKLVRQIIFLLLMFTFLELLLPLGQIKNFTRVVIGLLIILAILTPIGEMLSSNWNMDVFLPEEKAVFSVSQKGVLDKAKEETAKGIETQIKALLNLNGEKVDKVKVVLGENQIEGVTVVVKKPLTEEDKQRYREVIKAFFGVAEKVNFQVLEVGP